MTASGLNEGGSSADADTQPGTADGSSRLHTPGLWRNLGLSRLERVKAHRDEFGSSLKVALDAVDEDYGRQVSTGRARIADAATMMLEALQLVRHSTEWACMEGATQDAVTAAIAKATTAPQNSLGGHGGRSPECAQSPSLPRHG